MLYKKTALVLISTLPLFYYPISNASSPAGFNKVNPNAWNAFVHEKQRKYDAAHTLDKAPFPHKISNGNLVKVDLGKLAWGAYDDNGNLVKWGNASGGKSYCADLGKECKTVTGTHTFFSKKGQSYKSNRFPLPKGGAPMPYCMHFQGGYALHGGAVPDFNASHGCIRVPVQEAKWLNQNFVKVGKTQISISY